MPSPLPQLQNAKISIDSAAIATITYSRPKALNALNTATVKDILSGLQWAEAEPSIRVIITTGEGRLYTAGLDLLDPDVPGPDSTVKDEFFQVLSDVHEILIKSDKIIISAVNGPAPGWGTSSLGLSDLVYSTPDAFFFTPFVQWGLCPEGCSSYTFTKIMGRQKASALILGGARMTAKELETAGLITKVLEKDKFLDQVLNIARGILKLPQNSLRLSKNLMMRGSREDLLEANRIEMESIKRQARKDESKEAIAVFAKSRGQPKEKKAKL